MLPVAEDLSVLEKCQQLFIFKTAEPWCQVYEVRTRSHQRILIGKSDEENVPCLCLNCSSKSRPRYHNHVCVTNLKEKILMRITGESPGTCGDGREMSFAVGNVDGSKELLGEVRLFDLSGFHFVTGISNVKENLQFSTRVKNDSFQIIQDGQCVAILDFRRASVINWIESYMLTFVKDLSVNSKAVIVAACICYDIGFCQRSDSIKTILIYFSFLLCLFLSGSLLCYFIL